MYFLRKILHIIRKIRNIIIKMAKSYYIICNLSLYAPQIEKGWQEIIPYHPFSKYT